MFTTACWRLGDADADPHGEEPWRDVASAIGVDDQRLVRVRQVHGARSVVARRGGQLADEADMLISDDPELALAVRVADCVPLLLADRRLGAVAAVHAGWRGLAVNAPGAAVRELAGRFGTRPADLIAAAGPSIGACCYEVGAEVRAALEAATPPSAAAGWLTARAAATPLNPSMPGIPVDARPGRAYFDGWAAVRDQLQDAGVSPANIFVAELCTASHPGVLCSYRRDGRSAGRLAAVIRCAGERQSRRSPSSH
jgi:YfiH family protein